MILCGGHCSEHLDQLLEAVDDELLVSSPYVTGEGIDFLLNGLSRRRYAHCRIHFLTDLSPINVVHGATVPAAFERLNQTALDVNLVHLPKLHAKVFIADNKMAIVGSANLTAGGLYRNYEYQVATRNSATVNTIRDDLKGYSTLGARLEAVS